jgi:glycosyltransferase involved in cell wall biosynthesis
MAQIAVAQTRAQVTEHETLQTRAEPRIATLIPAFNEERDIARVVVSARRFSNYVIVCDDGSNDMTSEIARELGAEVIRHDRNLGYGAALLSLFTRAKDLGVDVVVTIDGDGQHDASSISGLIDPILLNQADVVIGSRFEKTSRGNTPTLRTMGIRAINCFTRAVSGRNFSDTQCGMRAYRTAILPVIFPSETGMGASTEILIRATKAGLRINEVAVPIARRNRSSQNPIFQGFDVIGSTIKHVSIKSPLRFYGVPCILLLTNGIFFGIWAVDSYIATRTLVVNLTVISLASMIMGLILGTTAVILYSITSIVREQMLEQSRR